VTGGIKAPKGIGLTFCDIVTKYEVPRGEKAEGQRRRRGTFPDQCTQQTGVYTTDWNYGIIIKNLLKLMEDGFLGFFTF
jgi:hypothetical protein